MLIPAETVRSSTDTPAVTASLTLTPVSDDQALRVARHPDEWTPEDLYEYVSEEITRASGPQLPAKAAQATIEDFALRFGVPVAVRMARAAFEVYGGKWQGAPITWRRFAPGHDEFFAKPLLAAMT
jgi:hypothetical protein